MNNTLRLILVIALLLVPIILSFILIPYKPVQLDYVNTTSEVFRQIPGDSVYNPNSLGDNINRLFGVPFDLNYYNFCYDDVNTTVLNSTFVKQSNPQWSVNVTFGNKQEDLYLSVSSKNCTKNSFSVNDKVYFNSSFGVNITMYPGSYLIQQTAIFPNSKVFAVPNLMTLWIKRLIFILFAWSLILLIRELIKFILKK